MDIWDDNDFGDSQSNLLHSNLPGYDWLVGREGDGGMKIPFIDPTGPILPQLYAVGGPLTTPLVSAITIGHHMYVQFGEPKFLAFLVGLGAFLGFEAAGGACVACAIKLHQKERHKVDFWICLVGIVAYMISPSLIIRFGYGALIFALLAVFAVFAGSTWFALDTEEKSQVIIKTLELKQTRAKTKLAKMQNAGMQIDANGMQNDAEPILHTCIICKETFVNPKKYAAHMRWSHKNE